MSDFLELPRAAQKAAFAHMGAKPGGRSRSSDRGKVTGFVGELPTAKKARTPAKKKPSSLGSGARHEKLKKESSRAPAGQQRVAAMHEAYRKGHTDEQQLTGGMRAEAVTKVKLSNGEHAVFKRQSEQDARREYLAGQVANAVGIDGITVAQLSDREVLMNFVDGSTASSKIMALARDLPNGPTKRAQIKAEEKQHLQLRGGREIAMLDWLTNNSDRHAMNYMISPDGKSVTPIDHGNVTFVGSRNRAPNSPFVDQWIRPRFNDPEDPDDRSMSGADPQWTPAELAKIRTSLEGLQSEFKGGREGEWYSAMIARLDALEKK